MVMLRRAYFTAEMHNYNAARAAKSWKFAIQTSLSFIAYNMSFKMISVSAFLSTVLLLYCYQNQMHVQSFPQIGKIEGAENALENSNQTQVLPFIHTSEMILVCLRFYRSILSTETKLPAVLFKIYIYIYTYIFETFHVLENTVILACSVLNEDKRILVSIMFRRQIHNKLTSVTLCIIPRFIDF